jgi:hypothetical protein
MIKSPEGGVLTRDHNNCLSLNYDTCTSSFWYAPHQLNRNIPYTKKVGWNAVTLHVPYIYRCATTWTGEVSYFMAICFVRLSSYGSQHLGTWTFGRFIAFGLVVVVCRVFKTLGKYDVETFDVCRSDKRYWIMTEEQTKHTKKLILTKNKVGFNGS